MADAGASELSGLWGFAHGARRIRGPAIVCRFGDGGQVQMPMAKTFFSPQFGMVVDRFGVSWMVYVMH